MLTFKYKPALLLVFLFAGNALGVATAKDTKAIPAIINYLLEEPTPLQKVLSAYNVDSNHIFIAAHRGGKENDIADSAPGNSIANIDNALSKGYDLYESDIEVLGNDTVTMDDDVLVVFHDDVFDFLTNSPVDNDALDKANLTYAKSLFLTYSDNRVSNQRIPTLEEFLLAIKGKIMVKFDLKSGTFSNSILIKIMQTVESTGTTQQVLIRGGNNLLSVAQANNFDTGMIMLRYNTAPSVDDITALAAAGVRAISIPIRSNASTAVMTAANAAGLIVEVHESQGVSNAQLALDWQAAIDDGFRQFHSFKPSLLKAYLIQQGLREF